MQDHCPAKFWIHVTAWGRQMFSKKRPTELFNIDEIIFISPVFLLEMDKSGWVFSFLTSLHIEVKHLRQVRKFWHSYEDYLQQLL